MRTLDDPEYVVGQFADLVAALVKWDRQRAVEALERLHVHGFEVRLRSKPLQEVVGEIDPVLDRPIRSLRNVRQPAIDALLERDVRLIRALVEKTPDELRAIPGFGESSVRQIVEALAESGLTLQVPEVVKMTFPAERTRIEAIRRGKATDAVVPLAEGQALAAGELIAFAEEEPGGESVTVVLSQVRDGSYQVAGRRMFYATWHAPLRDRRES